MDKYGAARVDSRQPPLDPFSNGAAMHQQEIACLGNAIIAKRLNSAKIRSALSVARHWKTTSRSFEIQWGYGFAQIHLPGCRVGSNRGPLRPRVEMPMLSVWGLGGRELKSPPPRPTKSKAYGKQTFDMGTV